MTLDPTATLSDLVNDGPHRVRTFERLGLDFCCHGNQQLDEACAEAELDSAAVIEALHEADRKAEERDENRRAEWADLGVAELVDHLLSTHHVYLKEELPRLCWLADAVTGVHGDRHPELSRVRQLVIALRADLEPHMMKEEQVLFPMIGELTSATVAPGFHCGSLGNPIHVMLQEHEMVGELLVELRNVTGGYILPADACRKYHALFEGLEELEADTHLHVHKENSLLFPAVLALESSLSP